MKKHQNSSLRIYESAKCLLGETKAKQYLSDTILCILYDLEDSKKLNGKEFEKLLIEEADWFENALK